MTRPGGVSLGGTLLAVLVLSMLGFALSGLCVTHLRLTGAEDRSVLAANAARSAAAAAISKILDGKDYGKERKPEETITVEMDQAVGLVRFNKLAAADEGMPYSTNNISGTEDINGDESVLVPSGTVMITAIGRSGSTVRRVDAALRLPPFPWAIASGGRIDTINGVLVAALPPDTWPPPTDESLLLPADLVANGTEDHSIVLGENSKVLGDVETRGTVFKDGAHITVKGEIRNGARPVDLPTLDAASFDPEVKHVDYFPLDDPNIESLTGVGKAEHSITFPKLLTLDNGQIFVKGNLTLDGGIQGSGIIIATGNIVIRGGASIEGSTELAVVSGGAVSVGGTGTASARIRGLFYAANGMTARDITLVGTLLTGNATTGIRLDHVNVYYEEPIDVLAKVNVPQGRFYLGLIPETDPSNPGATREITPTVQPATQPIPAGKTKFLDLQIEPTDGGFPVRITWNKPGVTSTGVWFASLEQWNNEKAAWVQGHRDDMPMNCSLNGSTDLDVLANFIREAITQQVDQKPDNLPPAVSLLGDLSEFLPTEDRIRVVSWVEH